MTGKCVALLIWGLKGQAFMQYKLHSLRKVY